MKRVYARGISLTIAAGFGLAMGLGGSMGAVAAGPDPVSLPVSIDQTGSGSFEPTIDVVVGGVSLHLMLDTGSYGLWVNGDRLAEMSPQPVDTGIPMTMEYNPGTITGELRTAPVTIGDVTTPDAVPLFVAESCTFDCRFTDIGLDLDGILGISGGHRSYQDAGGTTYEYYSPLGQLAEDLARGHTLNLAASGSSLTLGEPTDRSGMVLQTNRTDHDYPNGLPEFGNAYPLCWSIQDQEQCASAVFDSGELAADIEGEQFAPFATIYADPIPLPAVGEFIIGSINPETVVHYSDGAGAQPFTSVVVGQGSRSMGLWTHPGGGLYMNSGNAFFLGRSMGYDGLTGELIIGDSKSAPAAPQSVRASTDDGVVTVHWDPPASVGDAPLRSYEVTVLREGGTVFRHYTAALDAADLRITDLPTGRYRVEVAAVNEYGGGPTAEAADILDVRKNEPAHGGRSGLANSGAELGAAPAFAVALLLAGGALIAARRRPAQKRR